MTHQPLAPPAASSPGASRSLLSRGASKAARRCLMPQLASLVALLLLTARPLSATWSIVVVDHATGEVAIASATCLANFALENSVPAIVVGKGAVAAQSILDQDGSNRLLAFDLLKDDATPDEVLEALTTLGTTPGLRQYGIAAFSGPAATFSGPGAGQGLGNLVGSSGTLTYALQGNLLVGPEPVFAAEEALLGTEGDLSQRVMAAMQAARALGGDGRCSCTGSDPTGCGVPPPAFTKSAHCGFVIVARLGDTDGTCGAGGCANGDYYLSLAYSGSVSDPDPVDVLQDDYDAWRGALAGRPDGILSVVTPAATRLPADGLTATLVTVRLVDVEGQPLTTGGAQLTVGRTPESVTDATIGAVADNGDGTYAFPVTAGLLTGSLELVVDVDDGGQRATLAPYTALALDAPADLHVGAEALDPFLGGSVPLTLDVPEAAGGQYLLLATTAGTVPGTLLNGVLLPLNVDEVFTFTVQTANVGPLVNTFGVLDGTGRASARFDAPPGLLLDLAGLRVDWAALTLSAGQLRATNADGFLVSLGA